MMPGPGRRLTLPQPLLTRPVALIVAGVLGLLMACVASLRPPAASQAAPASIYEPVSVSWVGPDHIHIAYDYNAGCDYGYTCTWKVMRSGLATPLVSSDAPVQGTYRDSVSYGSYQYWVEVLNVHPTQSSLNHTNPDPLVKTPAVTVDGGTIRGNLLFDETLDANAKCETGINVPAGITLTLSDLVLTTGQYGCAITVAGTLSLASTANTSAATIILQGPQTFDRISNAQLVFDPGSGGSTVSNSTGVNSR